MNKKMKFKIEIYKKEEDGRTRTYEMKAGGEIIGSFEEIVDAFKLIFTTCPKTIPCATLAILNIDEKEVCNEDLC